MRLTGKQGEVEGLLGNYFGSTSPTISLRLRSGWAAEKPRAAQAAIQRGFVARLRSKFRAWGEGHTWHRWHFKCATGPPCSDCCSWYLLLGG